MCQRPCDLHNPCAVNGVCINTNHGTDCSCAEGYHGNAFVGCLPVASPKPICQYNEDCPPFQLCDRLNRRCMSPCIEDSCGIDAECFPANHAATCKCRNGFSGNPYIQCSQSTYIIFFQLAKILIIFFQLSVARAILSARLPRRVSIKSAKTRANAARTLSVMLSVMCQPANAPTATAETQLLDALVCLTINSKICTHCS